MSISALAPPPAGTATRAQPASRRSGRVTESPAATRVRLTGALASAVAATHVETDVEGRAALPLWADGSLELRFKRQQLRTVRLLPLAPGAPAAQAGAASGKHKESLTGVRFAGP